MLIWHPIPVRVLGPNIAFQEHFDILRTVEILYDGPMYSDYHEREPQRWERFQPALYTRYLKSIKYLDSECGFNLIDQWPCPPRLGAELLYPVDSDEFVLKLWKIILERP